MTKKVTKEETKSTIIASCAIGVFILALIVTMMFGYPKYKVWQQEMAGKAEFAKAEFRDYVESGDWELAIG